MSRVGAHLQKAFDLLIEAGDQAEAGIDPDLFFAWESYQKQFDSDHVRADDALVTAIDSVMRMTGLLEKLLKK